MEEELVQFDRERQERWRQLQARQDDELTRFDDESVRLGFTSLHLAQQQPQGAAVTSSMSSSSGELVQSSTMNFVENPAAANGDR